MEIRKATANDLIHIIRSLQNKDIEYNTTFHAKEDIMNNRLFVAIIDDKIVGSCAIVEETEYNYTAIKRVCVYNKKNCGKGIASALIGYICGLGIDNLGATPWNNPSMIRVFEKYGFTYQYTFMENYRFYLKKG